MIVCVWGGGTLGTLPRKSRVMMVSPREERMKNWEIMVAGSSSPPTPPSLSSAAAAAAVCLYAVGLRRGWSNKRPDFTAWRLATPSSTALHWLALLLLGAVAGGTAQQRGQQAVHQEHGRQEDGDGDESGGKILEGHRQLHPQQRRPHRFRDLPCTEVQSLLPYALVLTRALAFAGRGASLCGAQRFGSDRGREGDEPSVSPRQFLP